MSFFLANLGRRRTQSRNVQCLAGTAGLTGGTLTMRFREAGESWSYWMPFRPYFTLELSEPLGTKTLELELNDTVTTHAFTHDVDLLDVELMAMWYPETQRIANKLPMYHKGRRLRTSNWQTFMNAPAAAQTMLLDAHGRVLNSRYIQTCPLDELTWVGASYVDSVKQQSDKDQNANRISNPTLSLLRSPFTEPQDWALLGDWAVNDTVSLFGYGSMRCQPAEDELAAAVQEIDLTAAPGEILTAGLYYQTDLPSSTAAFSGTDFAIVVVLLYEDGDSAAFSADIQPGTDETWHLAQLVATPTKHVVKAFVALTLVGQAAVSPFPLHVGGVQLRKGGLGDFSFGTTAPHLLEEPVNNGLEPSKELWFTGSQHEFAYRLLPTRIGAPSARTAGTFGALDVSANYYRVHTAQKDIAPIGFLPVNGNIGMYVTDPEELLREFRPAFYDQGAGAYIESEGFVVEAVTGFGGLLWVVGMFEDQAAADEFISINEWESFGPPVVAGDRLRYLLVLNPHPPAAPRTWLDVRAGYPLLALDVADTIVDVSFANSDGRAVRYRTETEERYSNLFYDYAINNTSGVVWLRESNSDTVLV